MKVITLQTAIAEIKEACEAAHEHGATSPFWFLVGAGVSHPSVPLASEIIADCRERARDRTELVDPEGHGPLDRYSFWLGATFHQASMRQRYLEKLIHGKSISGANLRLAHLLPDEDQASSLLPALVVTPNFDNHLSRGLNIFRKRHVISDHPATSVRIHPADDRRTQVVHVHGSYEFYDQANLRGELDHTARPSEAHIATMASLLENVLRSRSPLVVGYSGWEGDMVMTAIRRRLNGQVLPNNIYWFCYTREEMERLPDFVKSHQNVRLVVPPLQSYSGEGDGETRTGHAPAAGRLAPEDLEGSRTDATDTPTLPAQTVFEAMIREFDPPEPKLFDDKPLHWLVQQFRDELPDEDLAEGGDNLYSLGRVFERMERALAAQGSPSVEGGESIDLALESLRSLMRSARYREVIREGESLLSKELSDAQREELINVLLSSATGLSDDSQDELDGYRAVSRLGADISSASPDIRVTVAKALRLEGRTFGNLDRHEEAIAAGDQLIERYGDEEEPAVREQVAAALRSRGFSLFKLKRIDEAAAEYDAIIKRYGDDEDPSFREHVSLALRNKGILLGLRDRNREAIAAFDALAERYGDDEIPSVREDMAVALRYKGNALQELGRSRDAMNAYDELLERFGDDSDPDIQKHVGWVRVQKAQAAKDSSP